MHWSLLKQAEAIWQAQHDRLSSELAQAQDSSQSTLAELQGQHNSACEGLQVRH